MIKRSTWVMVLLLGLVAALAYYLQTVPDNLFKQMLTAGQTPTTAPTIDMLIASVDTPLSEISVESADGRSATIKRDDAAGWTLSIDGQGFIPANQTAAQQIAAQVATLQITLKITATSDLSAFGLDKPAYLCKATLRDGKTVTFKIGNTTVMGDGYYLQKEDGSIMAVNKYSLDGALNLLTQPPYLTTPTPSPAPITETPTPTATSG